MTMHVKSRCAAIALWIAVVLGAVGCARIDPERELAAAKVNLAAREYDEAAIRLFNVIQAQPENTVARRLRGELALQVGDYAGAAEELDRARQLGVPPESVAVGLAEAWTILGRSDEALGLLDSTAGSLASQPSYWTVRAEALLRAERLSDAEAALDEVDRTGGDGPRAFVARARQAMVREDSASAEQWLAQAVSAGPDDPRVLSARADLYVRTGRLTEAAADLERASEIYRTRSLDAFELNALLVLAQVQLARNDLDAAEATAARLAEQAPGAALTAYFRGLVEYRRGRLDEAAALIQPLVSVAPDTVQFRALLGAIHLARGNLGQAEQQFRQILAVSPRDPAAVKLLAETHLRQARPEAALTALRTVEDVAAEDAQIALLSGIASIQSGNTEQGLLYLEQAAALDPANELLRLQLARAYLAADRDADASALLGQAFSGGSAQLEGALLRLFTDIQLGDVVAGTAAAEAIIEEFPREARALTAAAVYFQILGEAPRARRLFEQAAALETDDATARLFLAAAFVQDGRAAEAEQLLARVVAELPRNPQALTALAELLTARGVFDEAAELLSRAVEQSTSILPRLALAQLHLRQGDVIAAKRELDIASAAAPDNPEVIAVAGLLALVEGKTDDAAALLERAEAELPDRLGVTLALARAQLLRGQPEAARSVRLRTLERAPRSLPLRLTLGEAELRLGNTADALAIANELKVEFPTQSGGYLLEADAQIAARRYSAAVDSLTAAFERESSWPVVARLLNTLQLADRPVETLRASEQWVAANPDHVPGALLLANVLQSAGRGEDALRVYESVLQKDRESLVALNNAAWLTHELGRPGAAALAERAQRLAPDNASVLDTLGWTLLRENRDQEAIAHLSRAAELAPDAMEIRYHLAAALAAGGRGPDARSVLTALLAERGDFAQRTEAQRLLDSL